MQNENPVTEGIVIAVAVLAVVGVLSYLAIGLVNRLRKRRQSDQEYREWTKKCKEETDRQLVELDKHEAEWQQKIKDNSHLLTGKDWRDKSGKAAFVSAMYGDDIPGYLWYAIPSGDSLSTKELQEMFWPQRYPGFGSMEMHQFGLRIRDAEIFLPEIIIGDKCYPLFQTGHRDYDFVDFRALLPEQKPVAQ
jgi:hypothetical protein